MNRAVGKEVKKACFKLLNRILQETVVELNADRINDFEQRRILWTSYNNMNMWFENWERDLEELVFTERTETSHYIPHNQLERILSLDETCLSLGGRKGGEASGPR